MREIPAEYSPEDMLAVAALRETLGPQSNNLEYVMRGLLAA